MTDNRITQLRMLQNTFFGNSTKGCSNEVYNKINALIEKYRNENNKEILLRYLASCIPYNIHGFYESKKHLPICITHLTGTLYDEIISSYNKNGDIIFKPLLRPVSNMTEKEMDTLFEILHIDENSDELDWIKINDDLGIKFFFPSGRWIENVAEAYSYLNSINIDYLGLINKDLAYSMS